MDGMTYEKTPIKFNLTRKGGKVSKMTKQPIVIEAKPVKRYSKTRGEHLKDIVIAVLVSAVIAFVAGSYFANKRNSEMQSAVKAASTPVAQAPELK